MCIFETGYITLRPLDPTDVETLYSWNLNREINIYAGWGKPYSKTAFEHKMVELIRNPPGDLVLFAIIWKGVLVGRVELAKIDRSNLYGFVGIFIGEPSARKQGVATAAINILADYSFTVENLEKLYAHVYSFNKPAQRLMARLGFKLEGVLREHEIHHGARQDVHVYGLLKSDFREQTATMVPIPES